MRDFVKFLAFILVVPLCIILFKLCQYLWYEEFQEWWITLMWVLIYPLTFIVVMVAKSEIKKVKTSRSEQK